MTQSQLFLTLIVTVLFCIAGTRELSRHNFSMGLLLIAIPLCGWVSIWVKS
jgi:hypothetical protein